MKRKHSSEAKQPFGWVCFGWQQTEWEHSSAQLNKSSKQAKYTHTKKRKVVWFGLVGWLGWVQRMDDSVSWKQKQKNQRMVEVLSWNLAVQAQSGGGWLVGWLVGFRGFRGTAVAQMMNED